MSSWVSSTLLFALQVFYAEEKIYKLSHFFRKKSIAFFLELLLCGSSTSFSFTESAKPGEWLFKLKLYIFLTLHGKERSMRRGHFFPCEEGWERFESGKRVWVYSDEIHEIANIWKCIQMAKKWMWKWIVEHSWMF
jgi:hypothetical protein